MRVCVLQEVQSPAPQQALLINREQFTEWVQGSLLSLSAIPLVPTPRQQATHPYDLSPVEYNAPDTTLQQILSPMSASQWASMAKPTMEHRSRPTPTQANMPIAQLDLVVSRALRFVDTEKRRGYGLFSQSQ